MQGQNFTFDKVFHVSPFMPMNLQYQWRFTFHDASNATDRSNCIHMKLMNGNDLHFFANMEYTIEAMKAKDSQRVMALRGVMSAFTNRLVTLGRTPQEALSDEEALAVIKTEAKRRKDAIAQFVDAGREELAADEKAELEVLSTYLPEMMSLDAIREIVQAKIAEVGEIDASAKGRFMGQIMGELGGKADGSDVKAVVDELLE